MKCAKHVGYSLIIFLATIVVACIDAAIKVDSQIKDQKEYLIQHGNLENWTTNSAIIDAINNLLFFNQEYKAYDQFSDNLMVLKELASITTREDLILIADNIERLVSTIRKIKQIIRQLHRLDITKYINLLYAQYIFSLLDRIKTYLKSQAEAHRITIFTPGSDPRRSGPYFNLVKLIQAMEYKQK